MLAAETREEIRAFKARLRRDEFWETPLRETLKDRLETVRACESAIAVDTNALLHILDTALRHSDLVDPDMLVTYTTELVRVMRDAGAGHDFVYYLEQVIRFCQDKGYPLSDLYLARARYLSLTGVETSARREALEAARHHAQSPEDLVKSLAALAAYYQSSSQYREAIDTCRESQDFMAKHQYLMKYEPEILATLGVAHFYLFDYDTAIGYFEEVLKAVELYPNDRQTANALHHLGRIAAAQGSLGKGMEYYVAASQYQQRCPEDLGTNAHHHIRLGELLTSAGLLTQAREHLEEGQRLFAQIRDNSSAQIQIDLAFADIYVLEKNYKKAERVIRESIERSGKRGYPRGELFGLEKLFWLQFRQFHFIQAIRTFYHAMRTWRGGEMGRNIGLRMLFFYLRRVPVILIRILRGSLYNVMGAATSKEKIETCICPMHLKK